MAEEVDPNLPKKTADEQLEFWVDKWERTHQELGDQISLNNDLRTRFEKAAKCLKVLDSIAAGVFKFNKAMGRHIEKILSEIRMELGISEDEKGNENAQG